MHAGGRIIRHSRHIIFQLAEVAVSREVFALILGFWRLSLFPRGDSRKGKDCQVSTLGTEGAHNLVRGGELYKIFTSCPEVPLPRLTLRHAALRLMNAAAIRRTPRSIAPPIEDHRFAEFMELPRSEKAIVAGSIPTNVARPNQPVRIAVSPVAKLTASKEINGKSRRTGAPQYSVQLSNWNLKPQMTAQQFTFSPPEGAKKIDAIPVDEAGEIILPEEKK